MVDPTEYVSFSILTVSPFELFLLTANACVLDVLFGLLDPHEVMRFHRVSQRTAAAVQFYMKRAWDLDTYLHRWFDPPLVHDFYDRLDENNAIVSGSAVLRFLQRAAPYPNSDLDVYVPLPGLLDMGRWLQQIGYRYKPRGGGPLLLFDVAALTLPSRWMVSRKNAPQSYNTLMFPTLYEVFDFERPEDPVRSRVQVIAVEGDPREHVLTFHSTVVMNFFTGTYVASLFPMSTFHAYIAWACRSSGYADYRSTASWEAKYRKRGWRVVRHWQTADSENFGELDGLRTIADGNTWFLELTSEEDRKKVREERELQDLGFEIVTAARGPTCVGTCMTIAPPFTVSACAFVDDNEYDDEWPYGGTLETFATFGA
ncbi:hypothetical protein K466DRAFT_601544 [Polyporus arcularius HHB13444]|uniref:Uncharacterized protein n=1 Tax=Polyporus arcularius HHB13444 TaxID=1314778 RepID=A0A5C3P5S1_9APHY|nr:hypothetical protein K466DRAFT_601544 [Polyporus arcularius HHB13444]